MNPPQTLAEVIEAHADRNPSAPALVGSNFESFSFADLCMKIAHFGEELQGRGVGPGSRVGVLLPRGPEAALVSVAVACHATLVPVNPNLSQSELEAELKNTRLQALVLPEWLDAPAWATSLTSTYSVTKAENSLRSVKLQLQQGEGFANLRGSSSDRRSWAAIFKTSGTTGVPKRVPVTHENLIEMAAKMSRWLGLSSTDRCACILPIYYNAGFKATLMVPLLMGCSVALPMHSNPEDLVHSIDLLQPTWFTATPTYLQGFLDSLPSPQISSSLRFILSSASYLPESIRSTLEVRLGVPILEFYGLCEAGMMAANQLSPARRKPGTGGLFNAGEIAIRGQDGRVSGTGELGQILLRGRSVTPGYLEDIDGAPGGIEDGWLCPGDLGYIDEDGFLTIVGRTKEVINRGGEKISPYEVEKILLLHPSVREAAVFAVPHPRLGENVAAAAVLRPGENVLPGELLDFLHDRLAAFKVPRHLTLMTKLPRGPTGKISRPQLAQIFARRAREIEPPETDTEQWIWDIWHRLLKRRDFGVDDDFFEAGGDSLQAVEMLLEIERVAARQIPQSELRASLTIRKLAVALLNFPLGATPEAKLLTPPENGRRAAFFFCHGDLGARGLYASRLAGLMGPGIPVAFLHPHPEATVSRDLTMEAMAADYMPSVLETCDTGPIRLGGFCNGGLLAWEIAYQLEQAGRPVESITLIDTTSLNARMSFRILARALKALAILFPSLSPSTARIMRSAWHMARRPRVIHSAFRTLRREGLAAIWRKRGRKMRLVLNAVQPLDRTPLEQNYFRMMASYVPPKLGIPVTCILSEASSGVHSYSPANWRRIAPSVRFLEIPGDHDSCKSIHIHAFAKRLASSLVAETPSIRPSVEGSMVVSSE